jgi:hypothetical protein
MRINGLYITLVIGAPRICMHNMHISHILESDRVNSMAVTDINLRSPKVDREAALAISGAQPRPRGVYKVG